MKNNTQVKNAFFTIDVERFIDTECVHNAKQNINNNMLDGLDRYVAILDKYGIKATLFVLSDFVDDIYVQLKKHADNGHKIAIHGKKHISPVTMSNEEFREHIIHAKNKLENLFDCDIVGYRAPCFGIDREKLDILKSLGIKYDSSRMEFSPARHVENIDMDDFERVEGEIFRKGDFYEFGLSTQKLFGKRFPVSGGGYVRIPSWLFAGSLIRHYISHSNYYVFYTHPFEFSKERIPKIKKLRIYDKMYLAMGFVSYPYKMEYIIKRLIRSGYKFTTFEDYITDKNNEK